jgi:hypothetical protein
MNAKLLFAATLSLTLISPLATAVDTPAVRNAVQVQQAVGASKLHHTDYDDELASRPASDSQVTRAEVRAALKAPTDPRLVGPLRSRTYNAYGAEILRGPAYRRAEIKSEVIEARAQHSLRPAGEAVEQSMTAAPPREAPRFLARRLHSSGG